MISLHQSIRTAASLMFRPWSSYILYHTATDENIFMRICCTYKTIPHQILCDDDMRRQNDLLYTKWNVCSFFFLLTSAGLNLRPPVKLKCTMYIMLSSNIVTHTRYTHTPPTSRTTQPHTAARVRIECAEESLNHVPVWFMSFVQCHGELLNMKCFKGGWTASV